MFEFINRLFKKGVKPINIIGGRIEDFEDFKPMKNKKSDPKRGPTKPDYRFEKVKARRKMARKSRRNNR